MLWPGHGTGQKRVMLAAAVILGMINLYLVAGTWIEINGNGVSLLEFIRRAGEIRCGMLTGCRDSLLPALRLVYVLQGCCAVLYSYVLYELWAKGYSVAVHGASFAVVFFILYIWLWQPWGASGDPGAAAGACFVHVRLSGHAWMAIAASCAADVVCCRREKETVGGKKNNSD